MEDDQNFQLHRAPTTLHGRRHFFRFALFVKLSPPARISRLVPWHVEPTPCASPAAALAAPKQARRCAPSPAEAAEATCRRGGAACARCAPIPSLQRPGGCFMPKRGTAKTPGAAQSQKDGHSPAGAPACGWPSRSARATGPPPCRSLSGSRAPRPPASCRTATAPAIEGLAGVHQAH